jgi:PAS domain S-box-containing protein
VHKLFARQLEKATGADGAVDIAYLSHLVSSAYDDHDRDRQRTERWIALMIDEVNKTNDRLANAFEVVPEGLVLLDAQNRFVLWNKRYAELYPANREHLVVGGSFEAALRSGLTRQVDAAGREEEWIAERLARLRQSTSSHEQQLPNNRWVRVEERRTADGGCIGIRIDITELKQREVSFRMLFDGNPIPMWVVDRASMRFLAVNAAAVSHYGYERDKFLSMTLRDLRTPDDRKNVHIGPDDPASGMRLRHHVTAAGKIIDVVVYTQSLIYQGHDALIVVSVDVTARKTAEDELQRTKAFLDTVIDNVPVMIMVREAAGEKRFVLVNRAWEYFYSRKRGDVIGRSIEDVLPRQLIGRITEEDRRLLITRRLTNDEQAILTPEHGIRHTVVNRIVVAGDDGNPRYFVSVMDDVTDRREAKEQLLESNDTLQAIINASPVAIISVEPSGKVHIWNQAAETIFGYSPAEAIGRQIVDLIVAPHQRASFKELSGTTLSGKGSRGVIQERMRKDGTFIDVKIAIAPIFAADGTVRASVVAFEDISKAKLLEDQLRQAQKMEAIGQLTGGLAHDFNNLLAIVIGNLDLLRGSVEDDTDANEILDEALQASLQGAELNRRLLAFARRQPLQPKHVNLSELIADTVKLLSRTLGAQVTINVAMEPDLWPLLIDPVQLESALTNLAVNARDAMPDGGRLIIGARNTSVDQELADVHTGLAVGDYVMVEVSDTGTGMPKEVIARVFEPFFTTKGKERGTGLGLSMVFGFVKQSGGYVQIYSEVGIGTTLRVYLPRATIDAIEAPSIAAECSPGGNERVLAVEDNERLRVLLVKQLKDLGYRVCEAGDAKAALELIGREPDIDLLLTDIILPGGKNGRELATEAAALRPDLKVLFTSGFPEEAFGKNGALPFGAALLSKPYRRDELARRLRETFGS